MNMTVGEALIVIAQLVPLLQQRGLLDTTGHFSAGTPETWADFAQAAEAALKSDGLIVPEKVDQIIKSLPFLLSFLD